jgi:AhpD family alkylhydroperoxidase
MQPRLNIVKDLPETYKVVSALDRHIFRESGLDKAIVHLIKIRASQINGCAYCVDMHVKHARSDGFSEQWMHMISVWRESPVFTEKERAVLAWTEALTLLPESRAEDEHYEPLKQHFTDAEIMKLIVAIGTINLWNRVAVASRSQHPIERRAEAA